MGWALSMLSQREIDNILYRDVTFEEALRYLNEDLCIRAFAETLAAFYDGDRQKLTDGLWEIERSLGRPVSRDSIARNVRNWLGGKVAPDRENLIRMCFALGFSEETAGAFLSFTSDGGFHMRDPRDLAFAYGLRAGKSYAESMKLFDSLKPPDTDVREQNGVYTRTVADAFLQASDDASFLRFYEENRGALGAMHNTAYEKCFLPFMDTLICPDVSELFDPERKYSVEEVVAEYLRMNIPFERERSRCSLLQRTVRKYWPNVSSVTKMRGRAEDVTRKILLLLYLVTDGSRGAEDAWDDDELSRAEQFENHYWKLNAMLEDCGFSLLDPRRVFDWLVLFCLKANEDELMGERLQGLLDQIFSEDSSGS